MSRSLSVILETYKNDPAEVWIDDALSPDSESAGVVSHEDEVLVLKITDYISVIDTPERLRDLADRIMDAVDNCEES